MSVRRRRDLQPAHRGYRWQDIATGYQLIRAIVEGYDFLIVDRKEFEGDRIDDLEIAHRGVRVRRQFKSSDDQKRSLATEDFTGKQSSLRIDYLVLTFIRSGQTPANEYRLCATWKAPASGDPIAELLEAQAAQPTFVGWPSECFRLRADRIWPENSAPVWSWLGTNPEIDRSSFLAFCDRFIVELGLPPTSTSVINPGPLERVLIDELTRRVGIGRYPNEGRAPEDFAALAVSLANLARTGEATLTPTEIEAELGIRIDFGHVAQEFPIDPTIFYNRPTFRRLLRESAVAGQHQLVTGPPGAGKSWDLTRLAEDLRNSGATVARHYCYLEPGDELVERRVTSNVLFGNLLWELVQAEPSLRDRATSRYSAGLRELEEILGHAAALSRPVVLIVDGLDHIARVRTGARSLRDDETDIVERLATLSLPKGVALVIGSQPGSHLDPLRERWGDELVDRPVPPWTPTEIKGLTHRLGLPQALSRSGLCHVEDIARILGRVADRSEGNPLYATYLVRGLVQGIGDGAIASPDEWLAGLPQIEGDIARYYAHLYGTAGIEAQPIGDILGVIEFGVSETELREMLPTYLAAWVPSALAVLAPVLTALAGQGGDEGLPRELSSVYG